MTQVAYALRADYQDRFAGGVLNAGGESFDVAAALKDGNGAILVDTTTAHGQTLADVLDGYPALKRTTVTAAQDAATDQPPDGDDLAELTKQQLLELPEADRIPGAKSKTVDDLRDAIRAARQEA